MHWAARFTPSTARLARPQPAAGLPRPWRWAWAGGMLGMAAMLLGMAPAAWLAHYVASSSAQRVLLAEAQGTIWQGSARLVLASGQDGRDATTLPSRVRWTLRPRWLGADAQLQSDCCTPAGPVQLALRQGFAGARLTVQDARLQLPSALLTGLGTPWNTLQPEGQLSLQTEQLEVVLAHRRADLQGALRLLLQDASTRLSTVRPVGSYEIVLRGAPPSGAGAARAPSTPLTLSLTSHPGSSLLLSGNGQFTAGRLHFSGEARAAPERADALDNLLNIIGRRDGQRSIITLG